MENRTMYAIALIAVVVIIAAAALALQGGSSKGPTATTTIPANQGQNSSKVLFNDTPYARSSYLAYPGIPSQQARAAMAGFGISATQLANGSAEVTMTFNQTGANDTVVIAPGYKIYFVEGTLSDDSFDTDSSLGDDAFVMVDSSGYVVG
ncbi:MAG: hypothetical protein KGH69_01280 [Candidatus Micrarchaeota archaeon]|nr:hypothetical protein [Candidatus Micrarchaeota archaeon]